MPSVNPSAVPAGWYRDPLGLPQVRWWNGASWTNDIQERRPEIQLVATAEPMLVGAN